MRRRNGSILVGLLWCMTLLSVLVIGLLHTARIDLMIVKNHGDSIQAHYLALAGVEKAKALLYRDAMERQRSARHHSGDLYDAPQQFRDVQLGRGLFRVMRQARPDEGMGVRYGISDEESRLNLNRASAQELGKLREMSSELAAAILDWRDDDNVVTQGGAEAEYYASLEPPSRPANGPFQTTRELLMVRGMPRQAFLGEDANQNGLLDPEEDDGNDSFPADNRDGSLDAGWSGLVTVDSSVRNANAAGQDRVNVQSADEKTLAAVPGISADLAKAIVAYRSQQRLENLADLLEVTAVNPASQPSPPPGGPTSPPARAGPSAPESAPPPNQPAPRPGGQRLISEELFMEIADDLTVADGSDQAGLVNLNTASVEVLACLPGLSRELAQAIVSYRKSAGYFSNVAWLLRVDGMTRDRFKQVVPKVTTRSETFRILSEGEIRSTGVRRRIQAIVRLSSDEIETLSYREDL